MNIKYLIPLLIIPILYFYYNHKTEPPKPLPKPKVETVKPKEVNRTIKQTIEKHDTYITEGTRNSISYETYQEPLQVPNVVTRNTGGDNSIITSVSDHAVSLGNISEVEGNVEVVRDDHRDYSAVRSSSSVGMDTEDVDVLLTSTKKEIAGRLKTSISTAEKKIAKSIVKTKKELNTYIVNKTKEAIDLSTDFADKHMALREKSIIANMEGKTTVLRDTLSSRILVLDKSILNSSSAIKSEIKNVEEASKASDARINTVISDTDSRLSTAIRNTQIESTKLSNLMENNKNLTNSNIAKVNTGLSTLENNLTNKLEKVKDYSSRAISTVESNLSKTIYNNYTKNKAGIDRVKSDTTASIESVASKASKDLETRTLSIRRSLDGNISSVVERVYNLARYVDEKMGETLALIHTLPTKESVDTKLNVIKEDMKTLVTTDMLDRKVNGIQEDLSNVVSNDTLERKLSDINASIANLGDRRLEVFWYYGETCPKHTYPLEGGEIDYSSPISDAFEENTLPDYRGRFIRNYSSSTYIGEMQDSSVYLGDNIDITTVEDITYGGIPYVKMYYGDESVKEGELKFNTGVENRPSNVTLKLCIHE